MRLKPIAGIAPAAPVTFRFGDAVVEAAAGESVAAALLRAGHAAQRITRRRADPRGYYCGMGICWECAVRVEGEGVVRSCLLPARDGLAVAPLDEAAR